LSCCGAVDDLEAIRLSCLETELGNLVDEARDAVVRVLPEYVNCIIGEDAVRTSGQSQARLDIILYQFRRLNLVDLAVRADALEDICPARILEPFGKLYLPGQYDGEKDSCGRPACS